MAHETQQGTPEQEAPTPAVLSGGPLEDVYNPNLSMDLFKDWREAGHREERPGQNNAKITFRGRLFGV